MNIRTTRCPPTPWGPPSLGEPWSANIIVGDERFGATERRIDVYFAHKQDPDGSDHANLAAAYATDAGTETEGDNAARMASRPGATPTSIDLFRAVVHGDPTHARGRAHGVHAGGGVPAVP